MQQRPKASLGIQSAISGRPDERLPGIRLRAAYSRIEALFGSAAPCAQIQAKGLGHRRRGQSGGAPPVRPLIECFAAMRQARLEGLISNRHEGTQRAQRPDRTKTGSGRWLRSLTCRSVQAVVRKKPEARWARTWGQGGRDVATDILLPPSFCEGFRAGPHTVAACWSSVDPNRIVRTAPRPLPGTNDRPAPAAQPDSIEDAAIGFAPPCQVND